MDNTPTEVADQLDVQTGLVSWLASYLQTLWE